MVLKTRTELKKIIESSAKDYPDRIKFCIDRKREIVAIDRALHMEMEYELYDDGSSFEDIFGGDIIIDDYDSHKVHVLWEAHPNISQNERLGIGKGRSLTDERTIDELLSILTKWIY